MPHLRTLVGTVVTALAAAALAVPAAQAQPLQEPQSPIPSDRAAQAQAAAKLRSLDARDATTHPRVPVSSARTQDLRHLRAGADDALPRGTSVNPGHAPYPATHAKTPVEGTAALAQERYYSSYGDARPVSSPVSVPVADTGDGIAPVPFILGVASALLLGLAAGIALHQLHVRRRHATSLPA